MSIWARMVDPIDNSGASVGTDLYHDGDAVAEFPHLLSRLMGLELPVREEVLE